MTGLTPEPLARPGRFGDFGGRYVPEALIPALEELDEARRKAMVDPEFMGELERLHRTYTGRPSIITEVPRFAAHAGNARIILKREDLNHTGSHKINNVLAQALLTKRMGKTRVIAETGAGQHGVATATAAALMGLECVIYMGKVDTERQALNVARMRMLGAEVVAVPTGSATLKDAINDALRDWVTNVGNTHYILGTVTGPHPFPEMVRDFHRVIGVEARSQVLDLTGRLPDAVIACVGGGSNAMGIFHRFIDDADVRLIGIEAGGEGVESGRHAARFAASSPGVLHGTFSYLMQDDDGQTLESHSISAGLDYPSVGPEHAHLRDTGRAEYRYATDEQTMKAFELLCRTEGIIPALESAHALAGAMEVGRELGPDALLLVNLSGRGDKDMHTAAEWFGLIDDRRRAERHGRRAARRGRRKDPAVSATTTGIGVGPVLEQCRAENRAALVGYLPVGFPSVEGSLEAMVAMVEAGVDIVEVGIPYSDPLMDGPVIAYAADQALKRGVHVSDAFAATRAVRDAGRPAAGDVLLEPHPAPRPHRLRARPRRRRGSGHHHARPHPRRGRRVDRGQRRDRSRPRLPRRPELHGAAHRRRDRPVPWLRVCRVAHGRDRRQDVDGRRRGSDRQPHQGGHRQAGLRGARGVRCASRRPRSRPTPTG